MIKLRAKDVFMEDRDFSRDLKIKEKNEEAEMFEMIMDSVCGGGGKSLSKERMTSKFKEECKLFKQYMESLQVKPLRRK